MDPDDSSAAATQVDDSGIGAGPADASDPDILQVSITKEDICFSPDQARRAAGSSKKSKATVSFDLPASFNPNVPPPKVPNAPAPPPQASTSSAVNPDGTIRRRVVIESVLGKSGTPPTPLADADLVTFRARMEYLVDMKNDTLPIKATPIRTMIPWVERGKIILVPADKASGQFYVDSVNEGELKVKGHSLRAGWNLDLPESALITLRWETMSDREPKALVECPKKGLARMNGWDVDPNGPKEISFFNASRDQNNANVWFTKVIASRRICQLIQAQQGHIWISGGQATARWRSKPLTPENDVQYDYQ